MIITANTLVLENVRTSTGWASDNPILPDKCLGYDRTLRKYKMGDAVTAWASLPWWSDETDPYFANQFEMVVGRSLPYTVGVGSDFSNAIIITTYLILPDKVRKISTQEYDCNMSEDSGTQPNVIESVTLYGHDDGSGNNLDDLWVVMSRG